MIQWYIPSKVYLEGTAMRCPQIELGTTKILQDCAVVGRTRRMCWRKGIKHLYSKADAQAPWFSPCTDTWAFFPGPLQLVTRHGSRCQRQWFDQNCFCRTPDSMIPCLDSVSQLSWQWTQPAGHFSCITCMFVKLFAAASSPCVARLSWKTSGATVSFLCLFACLSCTLSPKGHCYSPVIARCHAALGLKHKM